MLDPGADARVAAATTDIAVHRRVDVLIGGMGRLDQQRGRRHDLARLTVAALGNVELHPGGLQFLADRMGGHALDGGDPRRADRRNRDLAGPRRLAVDMDGAGAAKPCAAAELAALQVELVAQRPQERHVAVHVNDAPGAIHLYCVSHRPPPLVMFESARSSPRAQADPRLVASPDACASAGDGTPACGGFRLPGSPAGSSQEARVPSG